MFETRAARVPLHIQPAPAAFQPHRRLRRLQYLRPVRFERQALQLLPDFGRRRRQQRLVDGLARRAQFAPAQAAQQQVGRGTVGVRLPQEFRRCHNPRHRVVAIHRFGGEASAAANRSAPAPPSPRPALLPPAGASSTSSISAAGASTAASGSFSRFRCSRLWTVCRTSSSVARSVPKPGETSPNFASHASPSRLSDSSVLSKAASRLT